MASRIYENVMALITEKGLTRCKVETDAGLGNGTIKSWKNGNATVAKVELVAKVLGVPIEELLRA